VFGSPRKQAGDRSIQRIAQLRLLPDHIQTVDETFSHNLEAWPHGYCAPRSTELPSFDALASKARSTADWYADYADALRPKRWTR
jgi:hypothetical protein